MLNHCNPDCTGKWLLSQDLYELLCRECGARAYADALTLAAAVGENRAALLLSDLAQQGRELLESDGSAGA